MASIVTKAHDRLVAPIPNVGTQERQRILERALAQHDGLEGGRRYVNQFSELFRELEALGAFSPDDVPEILSTGDVDPTRKETVLSVFETYVDLRDELAHPHAKIRSRQFLNVAVTPGSLSEAFPEIEHVIVSGCVDPSPSVMPVFKRLAAEFQMTILLPANMRRSPMTRADSRRTSPIWRRWMGSRFSGSKVPTPRTHSERRQRQIGRWRRLVQTREERAEAKRVLHGATRRAWDDLILSGTHRFEEDDDSDFEFAEPEKATSTD